MVEKLTFEEIFEQNKRRIHYHIHKMNIRDPHQEYFQEGLVALWNAYETYEHDKGPMATYFNYMIRNRLIDRMRYNSRQIEKNEQASLEQKTTFCDGNYYRGTGGPRSIAANHFPAQEDSGFWNRIQSQLTDKQWKWVHYAIIQEMSYKSIAEAERTTVEAVKNWGRQARKKLKELQLHEWLSSEEDSF